MSKKLSTGCTKQAFYQRLIELAAVPTPHHQRTEGRHGWYPCEVGTSLKLKMLVLLILKAKKREAARERWLRKQPQNRVQRYKNKTLLRMPVPLVLPPEPILFWRRAEAKHEERIINDYRSARKPMKGEEGVTWLSLHPAEIDEMLQTAVKRLEEQRKVVEGADKLVG